MTTRTAREEAVRENLDGTKYDPIERWEINPSLIVWNGICLLDSGNRAGDPLFNKCESLAP